MKLLNETELMKEESETLKRKFDDMPLDVVESLGEVIEYLWHDEAKGFAERGTEDAGTTKHIFEHLQILRRWLSARSKSDSGHSRTQAIANGELIDVGELARRTGYLYPVALTKATWQTCIAEPAVRCGTFDEDKRLWDFMWRYAFGRRLKGSGGRTVTFDVHVQEMPDRKPRTISIAGVHEVGDHGETVITMKLMSELDPENLNGIET